MPSASVLTLALLAVGSVVSAAVVPTFVVPTFAIPTRSTVIEGRDVVTIIDATRTVLQPLPTKTPANPHGPPPPPAKPSVDTSDIFVTRTAGTLTLVERQTIITATRTVIEPAPTTTSGSKPLTTVKSSTTAKPATESVNTSDVFITRTLSSLTLVGRDDIYTIIGATRTEILPAKTTAVSPKPTTQTVNTSDIFVTRTAPALSLTISK